MLKPFRYHLNIFLGFTTLAKSSKIFRDEDTCLICFGVLKGKIWTTECNHKFHYRCMNRWITQVRSCPYCRCKIARTDVFLRSLRGRWLFEYDIPSVDFLCNYVGILIECLFICSTNNICIVYTNFISMFWNKRRFI